MKNKILIIGGPTAVGKTKLSIDLAKELNGEIVSADSMQIYKYMDIGSAKVTKDEMEGVPHYLIDVIEPSQEFSVVDYKEMAEKVIEDIISRGKLPIIAGGTGLYINALTCNMTMAATEKDEKYREELENLAIEKGNEYLHSLLKDIDKSSYEDIHFNNRKRVIRALEVYRVTGKPFSTFNIGNDIYNSKYDIYYYVLNMDREKLYDRINLRVDMMMEKGLLKECIKLRDMGYTSSMQSMQGIGYKELLEYLDGNLTLEEGINKIKQGSRNYAKRQLTWFRRDPRVVFLNKDNLSDVEVLKYIIGDIGKN